VLADAFGLETAIWAVAALTAKSGILVAVRMYEAHPTAPVRLTANPDTVLETVGLES
jgi:hypothetical protein